MARPLAEMVRSLPGVVRVDVPPAYAEEGDERPAGRK
jgi:hypothetical protein